MKSSVSWERSSMSVNKRVKRVPYSVVNDGGYPKVDIEGRKYTPQEISAIILQKMKKTAEDYLGQDVKDAVITVPAYFSDSQRQATKEAGEISGLNVLRIVNEPTAAALAYGIDKSDKDMNIAVYDFGGGRPGPPGGPGGWGVRGSLGGGGPYYYTLDVSILSFGGGVFEVLSTDGDTHLGGSDVDEKVMNWLIDEFKNDEGVDISKDPMAMQRIKEAAEKAKIELSSTNSTEINLPYITAIDGMPKHLVKTLTKAKFESLIDDLVQRTIEPCKKALENAKLGIDEIDEVILVGGSTRIPAVQEAVKKFFGKEPSKNVNPDEVVSLGASVQGAILNKESGVGDIVLLDVTPLNLGLETLGNAMTNLIEANTTIPCKKTQTFTTAQDNQTAITVRVLQGNRPLASQNKQIGIFNLEGLMPAPKGVPQLEISFDIDANGLLTVTAKDKATNKEQSIRIEASSNLSEDEIKRMRAEAEANAEADKKEREIIDTVNKGDSIVFTQEKMLEEQKDNITADEKSKIEGLVSSMKEAVKDKNADKINELEKEINEVWNGISQRIYSSNAKSNSQQTTSSGTTEQAADAEPQDAEFEEVK